MNNFNWRPMATAPCDGTAIVAMYVITHVGGPWRPIDITPSFEHVQRVGAASDGSGGYWRRVVPPAMKNMHAVVSVGDSDLSRGWWTTLPEYAAAVPHNRGWHSAPKHVPGFIVCPLVFVRPVEQRSPSLDDFGPVFAADVVWPAGTGPDDHWHTVRGYSPAAPAMPFYLDGENVAQGTYRWLMLSEFFPTEFFEQRLEAERQRYESLCDEWRRRAEYRHNP